MRGVPRVGVQLWLSALLLIFANSAFAQTTSSSQSETKWAVEDVIAPERAEQFRISPDSQWVVWVKALPDADKDEMVSNLFLSSLREKKETQLTRGPNKDTHPEWSPDGRWIAFLSDRPLPKPAGKELPPAGELSKTQLWLINPFGGEPWPLTRAERTVKDFGWIDGEHLLIAAEEDLTLYERTLKEKKDDSNAVEDVPHSPPVRLFRVNVKTGETTRLSTNNDWIDSIKVSPDGKHAITIHQRSLSYEFDQKVRPATFLYDVETGNRRQIFAEDGVVPTEIHWTPDSRGFYVVAPYSTHPVYLMATANRVYYYDLAAGRGTTVDLAWENGLASDSPATCAVIPDGFVALLAAGARYKFAHFTRSGERWNRAWIEGEGINNIFGVELGTDGKTLVYPSSSAGRPEQWYRATLDGATLTGVVQLTDLNPAFRRKAAAKTEVVRWKGALDEDVEGILYYPQTYEAGKRYPLVLMIHGGPLGADLDSWDDNYAYPMNLYTQRGAFVLRPNYHGSSNYGLMFAESIGNGKYYDLEVPDIEKGVDYLIGRGLVDPQRLATMGWSNGAILTIALTVATTRYKVASAGAGDVEQVSDWAYSTFGAAFDNYYFGAAPYDDPQLYIRKSPMYEFKKVRTPTIVFSGSEDRAVGHAQAWMHFRTLQQLGQPDVRFIVFPGEPHGLRKLSHRRRKVEEELAWFDKYFFQSRSPKNEALRDDSPLAEQLKRQQIKRVGLRYGVQVKSTLVPETVRYQGLELGRFEVTRAQYAAFDKSYKFDPGKENYPANGVTFEQAQAYCKWLSDLTGETYRLGTDAEMEGVYKSAKGAENTLDYWAGYKPNPDDASRLRTKIQELKGGAPLLREVGSFRGAGEEELVFDLGGNVAEWGVGRDGKGKTLGGSAEQPSDPKTHDSAPVLAYTGLRVVKGAPKAPVKQGQ